MPPRPPLLPLAIRTAEEMAFAASFLTRLPLRFPSPSAEPDLLPRTMTWFPLVGAGIGLITGLVYLSASGLGATPALAGWLAVVATVVLTGGLHEDGLADFADGLGGGNTREEKLAIMRDSRIGSYGVLAMVLVIGLRVSALTNTSGALEAALLQAVRCACERGGQCLVERDTPGCRIVAEPGS